MNAPVVIRVGGNTAPTQPDLIKVARIILDNCEIPFGTRKITRLVHDFKRRAPHADGHLFFQYLASAVSLTAEQRRAALTNPDIARAISYHDPTGETAVNNVMRQR